MMGRMGRIFAIKCYWQSLLINIYLLYKYPLYNLSIHLLSGNKAFTYLRAH